MHPKQRSHTSRQVYHSYNSAFSIMLQCFSISNAPRKHYLQTKNVHFTSEIGTILETKDMKGFSIYIPLDPAVVTSSPFYLLPSFTLFYILYTTQQPPIQNPPNHAPGTPSPKSQSSHVSTTNSQNPTSLIFLSQDLPPQNGPCTMDPHPQNGTRTRL